MKVTFCALCCALFFGLFISAPAWSQTADELESLLNSPRLSYAQAARFVLEAADKVVIDDPAVAFRFANERKWLPPKTSADSFARLDGIALLLMRSFDMEGGFFYSMFGNSHYAYRELAYREVIQGRVDPGMAVSGDMLLFMVGRILDVIENAPSPGGKERARSEQTEIPVIRR
jgi:hypothetical protein